MSARDIILVSSGYDYHIRFWADFNDSKSKHAIEYSAASINALEITPNKEYVAFATQNSVKFIDLVQLNSNPVYSIDSHEGIVTSILFPSDFENCFVSAGEDSSVRINDIRTTKSIKEFFHSNYVNSVAIANNNRDLIAADENGTIKIWDVNKGEVRCEYNSTDEEEGNAFRSIAVCEKGEYIVGAKSNGMCYVFDYGYDRDLKLISTFDAHKNYIIKCVLSPEYNYLATCSADTEIKIWENTKEKEFVLKSRLVGHKKWVWDCEFSLDSKYLISCSSDKNIRVWSVEHGKTLSSLTNPKGVNNIALVDDESE